jgi:NADPH2:quinone reductase
MVIHYNREDVAQRLLDWTDGQGVDVALDTVGADALKQLVPAMRLYADLVSLLQFPQDLDFKTLRTKNIRLSQALMLTPMLQQSNTLGEHHAAILEQCAQFFDEKKLHVYVDKTFALQDAKLAHQSIEAGHQTGKIVLQMLAHD